MKKRAILSMFLFLLLSTHVSSLETHYMVRVLPPFVYVNMSYGGLEGPRCFSIDNNDNEIEYAGLRVANCKDESTGKKGILLNPNNSGINYRLKVQIKNSYDNSGDMGLLNGSEGIMFEEHLFLSPDSVNYSTAQFNLPENWGVFTSREGPTRNTIATNSRLKGRYIAFGNFSSCKRNIDGTEIIEVGGCTEELPEIMSYFERIYGPYPYKRLLIIYGDIMYGGTAKEASVYVHKDASIFFLLHELQHEWLGLKIGFEDESRWFMEGAVNYYAAQYMLNRGEWSLGEYKRYLEDFKCYNLSDAYRKSFETANWTYYKRTARPNVYAVDKLAKILKERGSDLKEVINNLKTPVNNEQIKRISEELSGKDMGGFFNYHIYGVCKKNLLQLIGDWFKALLRIFHIGEPDPGTFYP